MPSSEPRKYSSSSAVNAWEATTTLEGGDAHGTGALAGAVLVGLMLRRHFRPPCASTALLVKARWHVKGQHLVSRLVIFGTSLRSRTQLQVRNTEHL